MKYAIVTGASSGIGKAICFRLATENKYHVLINYLSNDQAAEKVRTEIENAGGTAELIRFDVLKKSDVEQQLNEWMRKNPEATIEVVVNNAGLVRDRLFTFMEDKDWDEVVDVKLKGFFNVTRCLIAKMLMHRYGRIINIASLIGIYGKEGQVNYAAANGGLIAASKALAKEIGKRNITVNAIAPGFIKTDMTSHLPEEELNRYIPVRRFGTPEEIADLVSFLASEKAAYINGDVITISGGM